MKKIAFAVLSVLLLAGGLAMAKMPDQPRVTQEYIRSLTEDQLHDGISGRGEYAQWQIQVSRKEVFYGLTPQEKFLFRLELIARHPDWDEEMKSEVRNGTILRGMTTEQALASWGTPSTIEKSKARKLEYERWVYELPYGKSKSFYVRDGIVTSTF